MIILSYHLVLALVNFLFEQALVMVKSTVASPLSYQTFCSSL